MPVIGAGNWLRLLNSVSQVGVANTTLVVAANTVFKGTIGGGTNSTNNPTQFQLTLRHNNAGGAIIGGVGIGLTQSSTAYANSTFVELTAGTYYLEVSVAGNTGVYHTEFTGAIYTTT